MRAARHHSELCKVSLCAHCKIDQCLCECHYEHEELKDFNTFLYQCWRSNVDVSHAEGERFSSWWDLAYMWLASKYPNITVRDAQVYVDAGWDALEKVYWSLDEYQESLALYKRAETHRRR